MLVPPRNGVYLPDAPATSIAQRSTSTGGARSSVHASHGGQAKLNAFKADFEAGKPPYSVPRSVIDTMHRATEELSASGAAARALKAGDATPPFVLKDPDGKLVSAAELLAQGPLAVSFYRGVWCPYCNRELKAADRLAAVDGILRREPQAGSGCFESTARS
jgi:Redoxin